MESADFAYAAEPTRNPLRYALALWRLVRGDPSENTAEAAIVEIGFARSKLGRRFARWEETVAHLKRDPRIADAFAGPPTLARIDLAPLRELPAGTLGRVFADHCTARGIDPNLIHVPPEGDVGWLLNHLYQTHDVWHVLTGWGNDLPGEVGVAGFYCAQFRSPAFFGYMFALICLNVISRRSDLDAVFASFSAGYRAGKQAEPLFARDWNALWDVPITELRERFGIRPAEVVGEGILAAA